MSLKQKTNDIIDEMDMDLKIAEEELTKDFDDDEDEDAEFESYEDDDDNDDDETEEDKQIKRTRHGKPTPYAPKNGSAPHLKHLYANYGGEVMPYINMFDLQLSYETSDIELLYHLCERINKMIDIINAENKYINKLTDWTEKKIHKLFKHQKKFEKYLLELLDEFEEQMQEEFSEFKDEITKEIEDFEALVNEELEAMNEEINRFENEMKERADAFEAEMKERADAFEADMKARADAFEAEVNGRLDAMDKEISDFEYEMKLRADNFENTINNTISEFETEMRNRASEFEETMKKEQSNYENEMNTRATEFESSMSNRADNFETSISKEINDFKTETTNEINEFESLVNSTINDFSTDWTTKLNDFETYINHHIEEFESSMDERADSFEADLKEQWNDFKTKFGDMYNEYITDISNQWNAFKEEMSNEWASEKEALENEMASYEETMNQNYNEFKESIENYIEACCENVNNEISSFEETVNKLIEDFENDYNTRLEETTREEVDAKITDIVNQSIYELIQNSEEFRNAISNVVNQLLEESETLKEMISSIVEEILKDSEELKEKINKAVNDNINVNNYIEQLKNCNVFPVFEHGGTKLLVSLDNDYYYSIISNYLTKFYIPTNLYEDYINASELYKYNSFDPHIFIKTINNIIYAFCFDTSNNSLIIIDVNNNAIVNQLTIGYEETLEINDMIIEENSSKFYFIDNENNIYYYEYSSLTDLINIQSDNIYIEYYFTSENNNICGFINDKYFTFNYCTLRCYDTDNNYLFKNDLNDIIMDKDSIITNESYVGYNNFICFYYFNYEDNLATRDASIFYDYNYNHFTDILEPIKEDNNFNINSVCYNIFLYYYQLVTFSYGISRYGYSQTDNFYINRVVPYIIKYFNNPTITIGICNTQNNVVNSFSLYNIEKQAHINLQYSTADTGGTGPEINIKDCPLLQITIKEDTTLAIYHKYCSLNIDNVKSITVNSEYDSLKEEENNDLGLYLYENDTIKNTIILINTRIILPVSYTNINNCLIIFSDETIKLNITNSLSKLMPVTDTNIFNSLVIDANTNETDSMWELLNGNGILLQGRTIKG